MSLYDFEAAIAIAINSKNADVIRTIASELLFKYNSTCYYCALVLLCYNFFDKTEVVQSLWIKDQIDLAIPFMLYINDTETKKTNFDTTEEDDVYKTLNYYSYNKKTNNMLL